jgi:dTDP-4-dehydrorhamnose 3,5-epimerase
VLDVIVDARAGSPTYGEHISVELSWNDWRQLWVPPGFLHGFCTLSPEVEFLYKVTSYYSALHDGVVAFDDPDLDINWPFPREELNLSSKDASAPRLFEIDAPFPKSWEARPVN